MSHAPCAKLIEAAKRSTGMTGCIATGDWSDGSGSPANLLVQYHATQPELDNVNEHRSAGHSLLGSGPCSASQCIGASLRSNDPHLEHGPSKIFPLVWRSTGRCINHCGADTTRHDTKRGKHRGVKRRECPRRNATIELRSWCQSGERGGKTKILLVEGSSPTYVSRRDD